VAAVGCKKKTTGVTPLPKAGLYGSGDSGTVDPGAAGKLNDGDKSTSGGISSEDIAKNGIGQQNNHANWIKDAEALKAETVHFEYDSTVIKSGDKAKVGHVADYLKNNVGAAIEVDGHCDERGTDEYNRSLGERRALAIREQLVGLGVDASRVDTLSFGRDKPVDTGHSEASHAKNRRGEFVVLTPPGAK
jgi:peptidoglycan-associated lipoprotein